VTIPAGYYEFDEVRTIFLRTMDNNFHYYLSNITKTHTYLLDMAFNAFTNTIELQVRVGGGDAFSITDYSLPKDSLNITITTWSTPSNTVVPGFRISNNIFQTAIGFVTGDYPSINIGVGNNQSPLRGQTFTSSFRPGIQPLYLPLYYKPSNPRFATQGGVSASALTSRVRYDAITQNAGIFYNKMGKEVGNALAYGVPENGYTKKEKLGFPDRKTPVFSKYSSDFKCISASQLFTRKR
jgi:hypothetical protein